MGGRENAGEKNFTTCWVVTAGASLNTNKENCPWPGLVGQVSSGAMVVTGEMGLQGPDSHLSLSSWALLLQNMEWGSWGVSARNGGCTQ
jgi:hypothetical protein